MTEHTIKASDYGSVDILDNLDQPLTEKEYKARLKNWDESKDGPKPKKAKRRNTPALRRSYGRLTRGNKKIVAAQVDQSITEADAATRKWMKEQEAEAKRRTEERLKNGPPVNETPFPYGHYFTDNRGIKHALGIKRDLSDEFDDTIYWGRDEVGEYFELVRQNTENRVPGLWRLNFDLKQSKDDNLWRWQDESYALLLKVEDGVAFTQVWKMTQADKFLSYSNIDREVESQLRDILPDIGEQPVEEHPVEEWCADRIWVDELPPVQTETLKIAREMRNEDILGYLQDQFDKILDEAQKPLVVDLHIKEDAL